MNGVVGKLHEMNIRWVTSKIRSLRTLFADMNFALHFLMTRVTLISKLAFAKTFIFSLSPVWQHTVHTEEGSQRMEDLRKCESQGWLLSPGLGSWVIVMSLGQVDGRVRWSKFGVEEEFTFWVCWIWGTQRIYRWCALRSWNYKSILIKWEKCDSRAKGMRLCTYSIVGTY